jgi:hypothetical protein
MIPRHGHPGTFGTRIQQRVGGAGGAEGAKGAEMFRCSVVIASLAVLLAAAQPSAQGRPDGPPYAGRPLVDVLQDLNRRGLRIVFSTSLVRPALRVGGEPAGPTPREVLDQVLRPHGLQARPGPQGVLIVARAPRSRENGAAAPAAAATLRGRVVDADTDVPLPDALVVLQRPERRVTTDADGRFEIGGVEPGRQSLFVSLVGYTLARPDVDVRGDGVTDVLVPLAAGAGAYTEQLTVRGADQTAPSAAPTQFAVRSFELQELRGVLADDPFRAMQAMPNAATGDDFRAEFSVRGSEFRQMGLSLDGVSAPWLVHGVQAVEDTGTIAMINGDALDEATLTSGAQPQIHGNRTGARLDMTLREGSRDAFRIGGLISGTSASLVAEGPLGGSRRGAWIGSIRQSYIDWLIRKLDTQEQTSFGFTDAQAKAVFDVTPRHQLRLTAVGGRSTLDELEEAFAINGVRIGRAATGMAVAAWRATFGSAVVMTQRVGWAGLTYRNSNDYQQDVAEGRESLWNWRADAVYALRPWLSVDAGASVDRDWASSVRATYGAVDGAPPVVRSWNTYDRERRRQGGYLGARLHPTSAITVDGGARLDHERAYGDTTTSPWLLARWSPLERISVSAGAGIAHQLPDVTQLSPEGTVDPAGAERARYLDASAAYRLTSDLTLEASVYDREESGTLRQDVSTPRLSNGAVYFPFYNALWSNAADVSSRGVEVTLRRNAPGGLVGWVSYAYGRTRAVDLATGEEYWGDFDQRHLLNVYGSYRIGSRTNVSAKLRVGSNMPVLGYFSVRTGAGTGDELTLGATRNNLRLPAYSRLDLRLNRTYHFTRRRLTLYVEVLNVLNHENLGRTNGNVRRDGTVVGFVETLFPFLPSAGIRLEF